MPTLLVWGRAERILPASGLAFFRAHLPPHARIEEPERCGHSPHLDRPAWLARTLVDFATAATGAGAASRAAGRDLDSARTSG